MKAGGINRFYQSTHPPKALNTLTANGRGKGVKERNGTKRCGD
jgi:hypothetical protein